MARGSCLDCDRKHIAQAAVLSDDAASETVVSVSATDCHIAQAIILLGEARLGYLHHKWYAAGHIAIAENEVPQNEADFLRVKRLDIMYGDLNTALDLLLTTNPLRAMVAGHLAEAESEARREHPELAKVIREVRLAYMKNGTEPNWDELILAITIKAGEKIKFDPSSSKQFAIMDLAAPQPAPQLVSAGQSLN